MKNLFVIIVLFLALNANAQKSFTYSANNTTTKSSFTPDVSEAIDLTLTSNEGKSGSYYFERTAKSGNVYKSYCGKFHDVENSVPRFISKSGNINVVVLSRNNTPTVRTVVKGETLEE